MTIPWRQGAGKSGGEPVTCEGLSFLKDGIQFHGYSLGTWLVSSLRRRAERCLEVCEYKSNLPFHSRSLILVEVLIHGCFIDV